ncbi:hypothetical protein Mapa_001427 [Marchantia paleacea]|nr:hypothetical protein Mapa_001427 [Marchantia paleacea]
MGNLVRDEACGADRSRSFVFMPNLVAELISSSLSLFLPLSACPSYRPSFLLLLAGANSSHDRMRKLLWRITCYNIPQPPGCLFEKAPTREACYDRFGLHTLTVILVCTRRHLLSTLFTHIGRCGLDGCCNNSPPLATPSHPNNSSYNNRKQMEIKEEREE